MSHVSKELCDAYLETGSIAAAAAQLGVDRRKVEYAIESATAKAYIAEHRVRASGDVRIANRNERLSILSSIARGDGGEVAGDRIGACRLISHMQGELSTKTTVDLRSQLDFAAMPIAQVIRIARGDMTALPDPDSVHDG